jgi:hypothetical protein
LLHKNSGKCFKTCFVAGFSFSSKILSSDILIYDFKIKKKWISEL